MGQNLWLILPSLLGVLSQAQITTGRDFYSELKTLNPEQKNILKIFKIRMSPILSHDYMKNDLYLIKFLQFNNFTIHKARIHLKNAIKWRFDNKIDEFMKNPPDYFALLQKEYPIYLDEYDKKERPICEIPLGAWPVRKAADAGIIKKLSTHLFINCFEKATVKVREQQSLGKNVSQWILLANMQGFNASEYTCTLCMPITLNVAAGLDRFYPLSSNGFWLINTPGSFDKLYRLMRPVLSPVTRASIKIFGSNESDWVPFLEKHLNTGYISKLSTKSNDIEYIL